MGLREAEPGGPATQDSHSWTTTTGVATAAMAASMLALYAVSALGPALTVDMQLPRSAVGALMTATFSVACVASLLAGKVPEKSWTSAAPGAGCCG